MIQVLLLAALLPAKVTDCVPARWTSAEPASLALLTESPINCLLVDERQFSKEFSAAARQKNILVFSTAETPDGLVVRDEGAIIARLTPAAECRSAKRPKSRGRPKGSGRG